MKVRIFHKKYQTEAQRVILDGLKEYFGFIDTSLNPDVYDIYQYYLVNGGVFVVGIQDGKVIATGGLKKTKEIRIAEMVRISVDKQYRRKGYAKEIINKLLTIAKDNGYTTVVTETTKTWTAPRALYRSLGFIELYEDEEDVYMGLELSQ